MFVITYKYNDCCFSHFVHFDFIYRHRGDAVNQTVERRKRVLGCSLAGVSDRRVYLAISLLLIPLDSMHSLACESRFAFSAFFIYLFIFHLSTVQGA